MGNITQKAKNMYKIVEENYITKVGGTLTKRAEEINIHTTEEDISLYSNTSIDMKGEEGITLGEYIAPIDKNSKILDGWWTKEREGVQNLKKAKLGDTVFFHIETKNIKDGEEIDCKLYDLDKFIWDYLNPDDDKFNKEEVHKKATVKNNKATIKLLLDLGWEKNLKDDTAYDIELYWKVKYKDISKDLPKRQNLYLEVGFSDQTLFFNFPHPSYNFPEMFANDGSPLVIVDFAKDKITGEIKGKLEGKVKNGAIKSVDKLNTFIATKTENIAIAKLEKGFLVDSKGKIHTKKTKLYDKNLFLDGKMKSVKIRKNFGNKHITTKNINQLQYFAKNGKKVEFLNTLKISKSMAGLVFENYQNVLDLNSLMSNGLDHSKPLSIPILKTNIAIPFELLSQISFQIHKEGEAFIKEVIKQELEEAKLKGIEAVEMFQKINKKEGYHLIEITPETLNKLINGEFKTIKELGDFNDFSAGLKEIKLLYKEVLNPNRDEYIYFIETIFLNY
ncbi:hypothetical protein TMP227_110005 [Tenacibaculum maritimum]|nr:hypothetical protein TMP227_110005 [Tenacibaculum maritimum]